MRFGQLEGERGRFNASNATDLSFLLLFFCSSLLSHFVEMENDEKEKIKKYKDKLSNANDNCRKLKTDIKSLVSLHRFRFRFASSFEQ